MNLLLPRLLKPPWCLPAPRIPRHERGCVRPLTVCGTRAGQETDIVTGRGKSKMLLDGCANCEMGDNANTTGTNRSPGFRHTPIFKASSRHCSFRNPKTLLHNHRHPALYHLSNMRWSQRVRCQGVCAARTPMNEGVRTLTQPYRSPLSHLLRRRAHADFHRRRSPPTRGKGGWCSRKSDAPDRSCG